MNDKIRNAIGQIQKILAENEIELAFALDDKMWGIDGLVVHETKTGTLFVFPAVSENATTADDWEIENPDEIEFYPL